MNEMLNIPLSDIRVNPVALREVDRTADTFTELVDSIKRNGILNPINVRRKPGEDGKIFEIIDGLHRFSASQEAGLPEIPAQVLVKDDADALIAQIVGNTQKVETKPAEYANGLLRLLAYHPTMTESGLASMLSRSPQWISKMLSLVKLDDSIQKLVNEGKIIVANAYPLTKLPKEEQLNWVERAMTMDSTEFTQKALERAKQIREANRQGKEAGSEAFTPVSFLRKKTELEAEMTSPAIASPLTAKLGIAEKAKTKEEAAALGFQAGIQWAMNYDPISIEQQRVKDADRRSRQKEEKDRKDAEKKQKRASEAAEKEAQLRKEAEEAKAKVAQGQIIQPTAV